MNNRAKIVNAGYDDALVFENPDYDEAIVGITKNGNVVYDFSKMIEHLQANCGMDIVQAIEFVECNAMRVIPFWGNCAPIIVTMLKDLEG